eukprot:UN14338
MSRFQYPFFGYGDLNIFVISTEIPLKRSGFSYIKKVHKYDKRGIKKGILLFY